MSGPLLVFLGEFWRSDVPPFSARTGRASLRCYHRWLEPVGRADAAVDALNSIEVAPIAHTRSLHRRSARRRVTLRGQRCTPHRGRWPRGLLTTHRAQRRRAHRPRVPGYGRRRSRAALAHQGRNARAAAGRRPSCARDYPWEDQPGPPRRGRSGGARRFGALRVGRQRDRRRQVAGSRGQHRDTDRCLLGKDRASVPHQPALRGSGGPSICTSTTTVAPAFRR
jgi:hypothetical protein